jgi:iron complex transport system permease protein
VTAVVDEIRDLEEAAPGPAPAGPRRRGLLDRSWSRLAGLVVAGGVLLVLVGCSLAFGSKSIQLGAVIDAFTDFDGSNDHVIVRSLRLPRTVLGVGVGAALGLAGGVMQGVTRNPLADPGLLGVEAGASLAVVIGIHSFGIGTLTGYVWFAFAGAALASLAVYVIGSVGRGGATPVKLALAGAALTALLTSLTQGVLLYDVQTFDQFRFWVVGSLAGRDADVVRQVAPFLVVGVALALLMARWLNVLVLGDDVARSLGMRVSLVRTSATLAVVVLTGAAVAACGPIGFVGLTVPHVARAITGPDHRWLLPWSMVLGPILLLAADVVGRVVMRPAELQVGIVTALLGAPFFIALVRRRKLAAV